MFRILATVVASSALLVASALPSEGSTAQATEIEGFASSASTVAYQQPVTFTGKLVAASTQTPLPDEPVQIEVEPTGDGFVPVATGTTGSDGQFTITTTLPSGGSVRAMFAGDTGLAPGYSYPGWGIILNAAHLPSRLVLDPVPRSVPAGTPVTFSGTMQVQVNGTWQPFPDGSLTFTLEPYTSSEPDETYATTSGADGRFSLTEPVTETSVWSVDTSVNGSYWPALFPDYARAYYSGIDGVSKTRITGFSLPAKDEAHHSMFATGTVQRWNGSSWVGLAYGFVQFYYRAKGSTTWHADTRGQADAYGHFRIVVSIRLGTSTWQARVRPAADTLPSTSPYTITSTVTDQTHFAWVSIHRSSSGSSIHGQVTDWYEGQASFSTLRGLKLRLYYRHKGSTTWHYYKTRTVGLNGSFNFSEAKGYGYYFKVIFPVQGPFLSCTSRTL